MRYVLVSKDFGSGADYYAGSYQFQGELYPYFAKDNNIKPKVWKTRKGVEKALLRVQLLYTFDYEFYIKEIE